MIVAYFLEILESTKDIVKVLNYFFRLFPGFCLGDGLMSVSVRYACTSEDEIVSLNLSEAKGCQILIKKKYRSNNINCRDESIPCDAPCGVLLH